MTPEEREAYIRSLVDSAPLPPPEDVDRLRALLRLWERPLAERTAQAQVTASDVDDGRSTSTDGPTLDQVRSWPATVSVPKAATALGVSRSYLHELIRRGEAPVELVPFGGRRRVITASLVRLLEGD
ncbi:helix-turn-helix domain-containing protein [Streptomyces sp. NPDC048278]|uniref:helix-turn-helix domain-containing protein n=1 Tax=Streptomyces sp. NPDC048278 TaxID=3155809 RepID=UPI0034171684